MYLLYIIYEFLSIPCNGSIPWQHPSGKMYVYVIHKQSEYAQGKNASSNACKTRLVDT